ncbi:MAG: hypothetical protein ABI748_12485, partial [Dokdonella sp.]
MSRYRSSFLFAAFLAAGALADAAAQSSGGAFRVDPVAMAGGGVSAARSACFKVSGTLGQAPLGSSSGGAFVVSSGFWVAPPPARPDD